MSADHMAAQPNRSVQRQLRRQVRCLVFAERPDVLLAKANAELNLFFLRHKPGASRIEYLYLPGHIVTAARGARPPETCDKQFRS
jgi:hypothetical protein